MAREYKDYIYQYECPEGCKGQGGKPIAATIRGWKKHMTKQHGGYTDEQLSAIVGAAPASPEAGRELFLSEAGETPQTSAEAAAAAPAPEPSPEKVVEIKTDAAARKLSAKMNKMQKKLAEAIPAILNTKLETAGGEWKMSDSDKEFLSEAFENCFDVLDVEFRVAPISKTLTSPLWVLLLPVIALAVIYIPKVMQNAGKVGKEDATTD